MSVANFIQSKFPPPLTIGLTRLKRALMPSEQFKRMRDLHARIGSPDAILAGPFKGMHYLDPAGHLPKMLGTFENELHAAVEKLCAMQPDVILNVGSAEGYYAIGLARKIPGARVLAYDISPLAQYRVRRLAAANGVEARVEPKGYCSHEEIQRVAGAANRPAIVIDCEGCEAELLDPAKAPNLRKTIVLVELHEMCAANVTQKVHDRFAPSHDIERIATRTRSAADLPPGVQIPAGDLAFALDEGRLDNQEWMLLTPKV